VLAADDDAAVVVVAADAGPAWLETWARGRRTARLPVASAVTAWLPTSDGAAGAAVTDTADPGRFEVRALRREADGWVPVGDAVISSTPFACADGRGTTIVGAPHPRLLAPGRPPLDVAGLRTGSECAFGADGAVVAQLSAGPDGPLARVVVIGADGAERWRATVEGGTGVRADRGSDRFVTIAHRTAVERDAAGTVLRTVPSTDDARYDERGQLVVLHTDGTVRWLP
jgi:hypothetical protein